MQNLQIRGRSIGLLLQLILVPLVTTFAGPGHAEPVGWACHPGRGGLRWIEAPAGGGKFALEAWGNDGGTWDTYFYADRSFRRGNNLRCTFRWWWDGREDGAGVAITGPWHSRPAAQLRPFADGEAMIDGYFGREPAMRWSESGAVQNGPPLDDPFQQALRSATSRPNSLLIRVTLGDSAGARLEWSHDLGRPWKPAYGAGGDTQIDTMSQEAGSQWSNIRVSGNREVYLGFSPGYGSRRVYFADIQVENDREQFDLPDPDPDEFPLRVSWLTKEEFAPVGEHKQIEVPKTLDLAQRARLSVHGLSRFLDHRAQYSTFGHGFFCTRPPVMVHDSGQSQNWGKVVDGLVLARRMCGSRDHLDIQLGTITGMLDYAVTKEQEAYPVPLARMLMALIALHDTHPRPELVSKIDRYAAVLIEKLHVDPQRNQAYFGPAEDRWRSDDKQVDMGISGHLMQVFVSGTILRSLVMADQMPGVDVDPQRMQQLKNFLVDPTFWQPEAHSPMVVPAEHGQFWGHHHAYTQGLLGLLYYAQHTGDAWLKEFVRKSYEYLRTYGLARIGLFGEGCTVGDMTYLAVRLSQWGVGDYWEDVDQYTRNHLAELQITDTATIQAIIDEHAVPLESLSLDPWCQGTDNDDVLQRCRGIFLSDATHPTLIPLRAESLPNRTCMQWVVCCTGNCTKALHVVWQGITEYDADTQTASIHLLLNRTAPWLDIDSYLPYEGRIVVRNKKARSLLVRVPRWVDKQAVICAVEGTSVPFAWAGNYAVVTGIEPGCGVEIKFPMRETTESYHLAWQQDQFWQESTRPPNSWKKAAAQKYTLQLRGNTLMDIQPRDERPGIPLYADRGRETFRDKAPTQEVERFFADP